MRLSFFLFFVLTWTAVSAEIIETPHFSEITKYLRPNTLVVLDIDDTLMIPAQTLGSDVWFCAWWKKHQSMGMDKSRALEKALADWESIRHVTKMQIVEEGTTEIIAGLQAQGVTIIGLTTQGLALATRTTEQLAKLRIDLSKTAPHHGDLYFINGFSGGFTPQKGHGVLYRNGILFTSGTCKGEALLKLLNLLDICPEHVVFINDKKDNLLDVALPLEAALIPFTGLRYSYSDERISQFSEEIANIQWEKSSFGHILSDEEAEQLIRESLHEL